MDDWHASEGGEIPEDFAARVKPELVPGERLIWASRSRPRPGERAASRLQFGLFVLGSGVVGVTCIAAFLGAFGTRFHQVEGLIVVVGLIACIVSFASGLGGVGALVREALAGRPSIETTYAISDRRAIIWQPNPGTEGVKVYSYPASSIRGVHRLEFPDGSGDVNLGVSPVGPHVVPTGFAGVRDVRQVEHYVREFLLVDGPREPTGLDRRAHAGSFLERIDP